MPNGFNNAERLLLLQRQLIVFLAFTAVIYLLFQIGGYFADLLRILAISTLVSYLVINMVDFLQRFVHNRAIAVAIVYVLLLAVTIVGALLVIPAMLWQVSQLITSTFDKLPEILNHVFEQLAPLEARFKQFDIEIHAKDALINMVANLPKPDPVAVVNRLTDMAMSTMTWTVYIVSISVVTFYFLLDGHRMKDAIISLFPKRNQQSLNAMAIDMDSSLQAFFKGQLVLGLLFGAVMLFVYWGLNVQYALLLSVFLGFCEILPVIGPPIGFAPALVAVAIHGCSLPGDRITQMILLTIIFSVFQQVKDSVIAPRYIGNVIGLHPVLVFIAIMIGAKIDGMLGIIIALPVASVINVVISHLRSRSDELEATVENTLERMGIEINTEAGENAEAVSTAAREDHMP